VTVRLLANAFDRLHLTFAVGRAVAGPVGLGLMPATASGAAGARVLDTPASTGRSASSPDADDDRRRDERQTAAANVEPAPLSATVPAAVPVRRPAAHADALKLAVHLRAATHGATGECLMLCGLLPGQSVRRLAYETAVAFVQLQHVPVLVVDLEPNDGADADGASNTAHELLPETDAASWLAPEGGQRPAAAVMRVLGRRAPEPAGYLGSAEFGHDLAAWRAVAAVVICCAPSLPDSVDTLAAATQCTGTVLVVPSKGATMEPVVSARDTFMRAGASLLGCVFDTTPAERAGRGRHGTKG
jgi:hypothetical protein